MDTFSQVEQWMLRHPCHPPKTEFNGHLQTIIPALRPTKLHYCPESIIVHTPDNDFLEVDHYKNKHQKLLILTHGLEGNSTSKYIVRFINYFFPKGYDVLAWNMRGCGKHLNNKRHFYHSGYTQDLDLLVQKYKSQYEQIYLAGFSLGGNLTLKWMGEQGDQTPQEIAKTICFSVPCHLATASVHIQKSWLGLYNRRFLMALKSKIKRKQVRYPEWHIKPGLIAKTIPEFDNAITAPLHGYMSAADYYTENSSLFFLPRIRKTTLLINAWNDPMLSKECFPKYSSEAFRFLPSALGGHCGFETIALPNRGWMEQVSEVFFEK
jgi:predicted alpha/beta-fold hydrolase